MKTLETLARLCAILAGVLMTAITIVTCASLLGRNTIGLTLVGDYELTAVTAGAAVALFLPWSQLRRGNIIVDFFTARVPARINSVLDCFGALMLAAMMMLLAWRTSVGGISSADRVQVTHEFDDDMAGTLAGTALDPMDNAPLTQQALVLHQCLGKLENRQREVVCLA